MCLNDTKKILKTQNKEWGFWGTTAQHYTNKETQQRWNDAFVTLLELSGAKPEQVRELLDARIGRHFADQCFGEKDVKQITKECYFNWLAKELFAALKGTGIPVQRVPIERLNRITRKNHQGAIAFMSAVTYQQAENLVPSLFEEGKNPFFLALDGITDVRNFGAIARTCECAAVDAVIIPSTNSVSVNADAVKTSAGALHKLPVCREQNLTNTLHYLKECGFRLIAATEKGDYDYTKADYTGPLCIIMGAEDKGVSYDNLALCDEWVRIPMLGTIESLNVSVAAGILIYEAVKQRMTE